MQTEVSVGETDDPYFIALLNSMVRGLASITVPDELWVIKIDNWFDHKWLRFSGVGIVDFNWGGANRFEAALDEFYQEKVTFPPFNPNRMWGNGPFLGLVTATSSLHYQNCRTELRSNPAKPIYSGVLKTSPSRRVLSGTAGTPLRTAEAV